MLVADVLATALLLSLKPLKTCGFDMATKIREINQESEIIQNLLKQYDRHTRPPPLGRTHEKFSVYATDPAVFVEVNMTLLDMDPKPDFLELEIGVEQKWVDTWLSYSRKASVVFVCLSQELYSRIWRPSARFLPPALLSPPETLDSTVKLFPDGTVVMRERIKAKLKCQTDQWKYPFRDSRNCSFLWGSNRYGKGDVNVSWAGLWPRVKLAHNQSMGFHLSSLDAWNASFIGQAGEHLGVGGNLELKRVEVLAPLLKHYAPTVGCLLALLILSLLQPSPTVQPPVSIVAIVFYSLFYYWARHNGSFNYWDIWMLFCLGYAFLALALSVVCLRRCPSASAPSRFLPQRQSYRTPRHQSSDYLWRIPEPKEVPGLHFFPEEMDSERRRLTLNSEPQTETSVGACWSPPPPERREVATGVASAGKTSRFIVPFLLAVTLIIFNSAYWFTLFNH